MSRFRWRDFIRRGNKLALLGVVESAVPLVRMLALSRTLELGELGYAAAITTTDGLYAQITDFALHRFVLMAPREDFEEALAAAHAMSVTRGLLIGFLALLFSPILASVFGLAADWSTFALVGFVAAIKALEHLEPKVAERDYDYGTQLKVAFFASGGGLLAMAIWLANSRDHRAALVYLLTQGLLQTIVSRRLARTRYRLNFTSSYYYKAFRFGFPLLLNGLGLAVASQGDRFVVGALLGLPTLGLYSVASLVVYVPTAIMLRVGGTFTLSILFNALHQAREIFAVRVRLVASTAPLFAGLFAVGIITLMNFAVSIVFGSRFCIPVSAIFVLAIAIFIRVCRSEPFTSVLLNKGSTTRLALVSTSSLSELLIAYMLITVSPTMENAFLGKAIGEALSLMTTIVITRSLIPEIWRIYVQSLTWSAVVAFGCGLCSALYSDSDIARIASLVTAITGLGLLAARLMPAALWKAAIR